MSEAVLLLSGWGVDKRIWQTLAPHWDATREVTAIDWPGYGSTPACATHFLSELAEIMAPALRPDAVWVGWSLGGLLACALLDHLPPPSALILLGCGPRFCTPSGVTPEALARFRDAFMRDPLSSWHHFLRWQSQGEPHPRRVGHSLKTLMGATPPADTPTLLAGLDWLEQLDNTHRLHHAPCPIYRITGQHDPFIRPEPMANKEAAEMHLGAPTEKYAGTFSLPGVGHCPMLSAPATLAQLLQTLLLETTTMESAR
ncbi:alpha/beta fold hydrolase [Halomonas dongshanensis]|uniref:Alpha/beta fold hydrolase n=1 Tax=Halomonas dongshanensis TaxID=2890835 RepID=A0ABT2EBA5_9GAMM|nr:alpha/beta fold hydrolase [Halomonas dongshanensis]MCS2608375.1 alpha/beta fold hydrolase [Halomonas dongshanensis]